MRMTRRLFAALPFLAAAKPLLSTQAKPQAVVQVQLDGYRICQCFVSGVAARPLMYVNGEKVWPGAVVQDGDRLELGLEGYGPVNPVTVRFGDQAITGVFRS
jgi:hypothetical protein